MDLVTYESFDEYYAADEQPLFWDVVNLLQFGSGPVPYVESFRDDLEALGFTW